MGVEKDFVLSKKYLFEASEKGNYVATNQLAFLYLNGSEGFEKDISLAVDLYSKSAKMGNNEAIEMLKLLKNRI